jgi:hypothetical protein
MSPAGGAVSRSIDLSMGGSAAPMEHGEQDARQAMA